MLTDDEWEVIGPLLTKATSQIKQYREAHRCSLADARAKEFGDEALDAYERITGFRESNADALYHHRLSQYGPPCSGCGKPLRTPTARYCAACGALR